jgi:hypothetical protein
MKIAVVTVHGVADQQPEETANTVTDLLLHLHPDTERSCYTGFKTHHLRIPLRGVRVEPAMPAFDGSDSEKCQHQFLRGQLKHYKEPDPAATYQTIRNEGPRRSADGAEKEVHIYEMYWADLSRLGNSFLTFFVELYQLLFHLCTVGAKTARFAAAQHREIWSWQAFSRCIQCASHCIRLPIPIANLFVLALVVLAGAAEVPADKFVVRELIIGALCIGAGVGLAFLLRHMVGGSNWPYVLLAVALAIGALWPVMEWRVITSKNALLILLYGEVWVLLLFALWQILKAYEKRHPHAKKWGLALAIVSSLFLVVAFCRGLDVTKACQLAGGLLLTGLGYVWLLVILTAFLACCLGWLAVSRTDPVSRKSARRAVFTANLVTSMTGFVMLVINIALWGVVASGLKSVLPAGKYPALSNIAVLIQANLSTTTIIPGMATLLILMALGSLWAIWSLVPTVRSEVQTPPPKESSSRWIGRSLTTGFRVMTWSGYLAIACFSILLLAAIVLPYVVEIGYLKTWDHPMAVELFKSFSWVILLFLVAPFFLKGFVIKLSAGFRQGLDVALDVINYLREHPEDYTIRAQIFARYVSLLRYICNWRALHDGAGYDRIIIVAHSQGTMITVDLLRFLQVERDPELQFLDTPDHIRLFTMGCPLRQLYGLRFPHIYDWARHSGDPRPGHDLPANQPPDPMRLLSVGKWVNAYRSGDYVGRNLWRSEKDADVYDIKAVVEDPQKTRREFCIGGGAHIHYWDKTAPRIAAELDELIANA